MTRNSLFVGLPLLQVRPGSPPAAESCTKKIECAESVSSVGMCSRNKKLVETSATLLVTSAILVVTRS